MERTRRSHPETILIPLLALTFGGAIPEASASFTSDGSMGLPGFKAGVVMAWGDYDDDGDLDLLAAGDPGTGTYITRIYRQDPGPAFVSVDPGLPGVNRGSVAWDDEDGDGDLDILLCGDANGSPLTAVYLQTSPGVFLMKGTVLQPVTDGEAAWGDYDNDGDLDVLVSGLNAGVRYTRVYRHNPDGQYEWVTAVTLTGLSGSGVSWVDTDGDGDRDIFVNGFDGINYVSRLYRNDGNEVFVSTQDLTGVAEGKAAWGDYDVDGDLDLILTGRGPTSGSDDDALPQRVRELHPRLLQRVAGLFPVRGGVGRLRQRRAPRSDPLRLHRLDTGQHGVSQRLRVLQLPDPGRDRASPDLGGRGGVGRLRRRRPARLRDGRRDGDGIHDRVLPEHDSRLPARGSGHGAGRRGPDRRPAAVRPAPHRRYDLEPEGGACPGRQRCAVRAVHSRRSSAGRCDGKRPYCVAGAVRAGTGSVLLVGAKRGCLAAGVRVHAPSRTSVFSGPPTLAWWRRTPWTGSGK